MENTHNNHINSHLPKRNHFEMKATLSHGWSKFKSQWSNILMAFFAYIVAIAPFEIITYFWDKRVYVEVSQWSEILQDSVAVSKWVAGPAETILYVIFSIIVFFWGLIIGYNLIKSYFSIYDEDVYKFSQMFVIPNKENFENFTQYILGTIVYVVGFLLGLILLIIPGIYFALRFQFIFNLIIDKKMRVKEAFAMSTKMTENIKWKLLGFGFLQAIISFGIIVVGLIALLVGVIPAVFVAMGWVMMTSVGLYRRLYLANK